VPCAASRRHGPAPPGWQAAARWIWCGLAMLASQIAMMAVMGTAWWHDFAAAMASLAA